MQNPLLRRTVTQLARGLDLAFSGAALNPPRSLLGMSFARVPKAERLDHAGRLRVLALIESFYSRPEFLSTQNALLPRPAAVQPEQKRVRSYVGRGEVIDLRWPSRFEPLWSRAAVLSHLESLSEAQQRALGFTPGALDLRTLGIDRSADLPEKYLRAQANQTARARWYKHAGAPRPCVVLLHGYLAGNYALEERIWPLKRLFQSGLDVVISVLPLHGPRRAESRGYLPPAFPSSDPRFTIEGFRQLVFDQRALFDYLRLSGAGGVGVMGISLGGYAASLLATVESSLRFAVFMVPLAAIEDFAHKSGRMTGDLAQQLLQRDALARAQASISPFSRPSLLPASRVITLAGEADQVTGLDQAKKLAQHFGGHMSVFHGGHVLHAGREAAFEPVWRMLNEVAVNGLA